MKKTLVIAIMTAIALVSCNNKNQKLDPNAKLSITGLSSSVKSENTSGIQGTEITDSVEFVLKYAWEHSTSFGRRGMGSGSDYLLFRDFSNRKFIFWGTDVISSRGDLSEAVMLWDDNVFTVGLDKQGKILHPKDYGVTYTWDDFSGKVDTVAYIPQSVINEARAAIVKAFEAGDYETCYKLFDNAYIFRPTTGAKWRALKAQGKH